MLVTASTLFAQTEDDIDSLLRTAPIDSLIYEYSVGLEKKFDLVDVFDEADRRLNHIYNELMKRRAVNSDMLKTAQRNWIKYRDAEFQFITSQSEDKEGTMYPIIRWNQKIRIVSHRVDELEAYNIFLLANE